MLSTQPRVPSSAPPPFHGWPNFLLGLLVSLSIFLFFICAPPAYAQIDSEPASEHSLLFDPAGSPPTLDASSLEGDLFESSYWIWVVLPRLFPEYLTGAGGYLSLGFPWGAGEEVPVGITKLQPTRFTQSRQRLDCLGCHQATPGSESKRTLQTQDSVYVQAAFTHQAYENFLSRCAEDPRFDAEYLLPAIGYNHPMNWLTEQQYRYRLIPEARKAFLKKGA